MQTLDLIIIFGYLIGITAFGIWFSGKQETTEDYFVGDRNVPWWAIAMSIVDQAKKRRLISNFAINAEKTIMRRLKGISVIFLALVLMSSPACSIFETLTEEDCGYSASYDDDGEVQILFSRITAEISFGKRECGFQYIRTRVENPMVGGSPLTEVAHKDEYLYSVPTGMDPAKETISIKIGEKRYISDLTSLKRIDKRVYIRLK